MKLGRQPRKFNPRVPHLSAMMAQKRMGVLAPPPPSVDWLSVFVSGFSFGMMLNDQLGDCTCAGIYHARQIWTANANPPCDTESDDNVKLAYCQTCGYHVNDPKTDQGGNEQDVLTFWMNQGIPISQAVGPIGDVFDKLAAFFEVDVRHVDDVKHTISWCGGCYIGMDIPAYIMASIPALWTLQDIDNQSIGGHCVYLCGYDATGPFFISWGSKYQMTWEYFLKYVDEAYGLVDRAWINTTGKTPAGLSLVELVDQMQALKTI